MRRHTLLSLFLMLMACGHTTVDGTLGSYSFYSLSANGERTGLVVMEPPNVLCQVVDLAVAATDVPGQWKQYAITTERHARLVELVDDTALVERYRIDARSAGNVRECIEDTSICYEPGIDLSPGPLSRLGNAAYVLHIPPETDEAWTEETTRMAEDYAAVSKECISQGTPVSLSATFPQGCGSQR
ncbi:MAG: hypothetical protein WCE62_12735 [Polyangiales bacterium]